jgi:hypothetical protein
MRRPKAACRTAASTSACSPNKQQHALFDQEGLPSSRPFFMRLFLSQDARPKTGIDQSNNPGQQSTMTTALTLFGRASGKRIARTLGLQELSVGRCEVGLTDPQGVMVLKVINEWRAATGTFDYISGRSRVFGARSILQYCCAAFAAMTYAFLRCVTSVRICSPKASGRPSKMRFTACVSISWRRSASRSSCSLARRTAASTYSSTE